ncbi:hypothetical protein ZIOFF_031802 [Zingiber officinale]|uniref:DUF8040 domain-containing protein n=1 Tax=Zingiber officinale TaxID=94328 RepID=A0A8J5L0L7_ZINOF|nr:hypothetical protein ZIOFF_031802 [Zingiber officinale]
MEKYEWSKANVVMFVEIIYDKVKHNKLQTSTFSNVIWEEINKELYQATKTNYDVDRLKDSGKVNAPEEVWAEFYMIMSSSDDEYDELGLDINLLIVLGIANDCFHDMMTEYLGYIDRMPCRTSCLTRRMYIQEILDGHPQVCFDNFRMSKHVFVNFCSTRKEMNLLQDGKKVTVEEGVAVFLLIVGHNTIHRICADRFQHSFYTSSK